ncbi:MAG: phosphoribosylaminoimidazolesuccinocarboxamide synthase [archaeon]
MIPITIDIGSYLGSTVQETSFPIGKLYKGKVRDNYILGDKRIIVASDRISAFDKVIGTIPLKGQVLNQMAVFWFDATRQIMANHLIDSPDPNVSVVREVEPLPVEMVVRGYITGSLWRDYESGNRDTYGFTLPDGMKKDEKFPIPIITPTTKAEYGEHDTPISKGDIIAKGLVDKELYEEIEKLTLALFSFGAEHLAKQGLILVDTKYEFGLLDGKPILMDEIHTSDSSRFWNADTYDELFAAGKTQAGLDKEYVRNWLREHGFAGDGEPPALPETIMIGAAEKYIEAYERITGQGFIPGERPVPERIERNLKTNGYFA